MTSFLTTSGSFTGSLHRQYSGEAPSSLQELACQRSSKTPTAALPSTTWGAPSKSMSQRMLFDLSSSGRHSTSPTTNERSGPLQVTTNWPTAMGVFLPIYGAVPRSGASPMRAAPPNQPSCSGPERTKGARLDYFVIEWVQASPTTRFTWMMSRCTSYNVAITAEPCFFGDEDCCTYLHWLGEALTETDGQLHAYAPMTNHVHLLVTSHRAATLPKLISSLGRRYVQYINTSYRRTGTLWDSRYKSSLTQAETYLLTCMRYIEVNPVRPTMGEDPAHYRWKLSSQRPRTNVAAYPSLG